MSEDINHRLERLEESNSELRKADVAMQQTLQELVTNTQLINLTLKMLTDDIHPRIKELEKEQGEIKRQLSNNSLIINAVKSVAMLIASVGIGMVLLHLFGG
ncbi:hypothetical protein M316_0103 [Nitrincola phage 1M3-16]|uniref:hypothetical protein n=1 Tax=Nitrincola phage 1M3-16 TaxID=1472912 RepID=UPI000444C07C|nr:hypothetical protein GJ22_gp049 [Nitrincola phage 1M3-16]AHX01168.1 hypothetical protein M316_0103 [Nitrincola phage 1M3-16]